MKRLQSGIFVSLLGCLIALNGCKKDTEFSSEKQSDIEKQLTAVKTTSLGNTALKTTSGNITVSGGGTIDELGATTTYTFHAVQKRNGETSGHFLFHFRAVKGSMYVKLDCLRLFGDNKATMSGVITKIYGRGLLEGEPPPFIYVGGRVSFTVQDNGEGGSAPSDLISDIGELIPGTPASCNDEWPLYLSGVNVQIKK